MAAVRYCADVPTLAAFYERLGLSRVLSSRGEGFVTLRAGGGLVMLHAAGNALTGVRAGLAALAFEVTDLDAAERTLAGLDPVRWDESYGEHLGVRDPGGDGIWITEVQRDLYGYRAHAAPPNDLNLLAVRAVEDVAASVAFYARMGLAPRPGGGSHLAAPAAPAVALYVAGVALAVWASVGTVRRLLADEGTRLRPALVFAALCLVFFGGHDLVPLAVVAGLGHGAGAASATVGAGLVAWSVAGARPPHADLRMLGQGLLAAALAVEVWAVLAAGAAALAVAIGAWAIGGLGMGLAYPRLYTAPLAGLAPSRVADVATAVVFAELAGTAVGALVGGGAYSLLSARGTGAPAAIAVAFGLIAVVALGTVTAQFGGARRASSAGTSSSTSG